MNPWGLVETLSGTLRVANEATGTSTAFGPRGAARGPVFDVGPGGEGGPTGIVINRHSGQFLLHEGKRSRPAQFIFCTLDGSLFAWNPRIDLDHAVQVSHDAKAAYTGLAIATFRSHPFLYVANFAGGKIEVYDSDFEETDLPGDFSDPDLPDGYAPFNVQNVDGRLIVAYALRSEEGDEEAGAGLGLVDVFDAGGHLLRRLTSHGTLNAPWGIALAPRDFGRFGGALIVGNFGDGTLNAFDRHSGEFLGQLEDRNGDPIVIKGLWGIAFARGEHGENRDDDGHDGDRRDKDGDDESARLYFAAGIEGETHGLFGFIRGVRGEHAKDDAAKPVAAVASSQALTLHVVVLGTQPARLSSSEGVSFRVAAPAGAVLDFAVFDAAGRRVAQPARALPTGAGSEVRWNATGASGARVQPGAYFWRATAAGHTVTGRIVLLP